MDRIFGEIRQLGYVVRDIRGAMERWAQVMGVGPWFYFEVYPVENFLYRGNPSKAKFSVAVANSGPLQLELIEPLDDLPSLYREFLDAGREGLQHLGFWTDEVERDLGRASRAGYDICQSGDTARGPFYYLETESHVGITAEFIAMTEDRRRIYAEIEAAAKTWDGREPIRKDWPT